MHWRHTFEERLGHLLSISTPLSRCSFTITGLQSIQENPSSALFRLHMKALHGTNFKLIMANLQNYFCNHHFHYVSTTASAILLCITLILKPFPKRRSTNSTVQEKSELFLKNVTPRTVRASFWSALNFGSATNTKFANNASTVIIIIFAHTSTKPSPLAFALCSHPCQHTISSLIQMQPGRHDVIAAPPTTTTSNHHPSGPHTQES